MKIKYTGKCGWKFSKEFGNVGQVVQQVRCSRCGCTATANPSIQQQIAEWEQSQRDPDANYSPGISLNYNLQPVINSGELNKKKVLASLLLPKEYKL